VSGIAGAAEFGAGVVSGAGAPSLPSRTDFGACACVDINWSMNARARNTPPPHQEIFVSRLPAWRIPMNASGEELAPPKLAERPPPVPLWSRIAPIRTMLTMMRSTRRKVYM